jgi:hypothetical protein
MIDTFSDSILIKRKENRSLGNNGGKGLQLPFRPLPFFLPFYLRLSPIHIRHQVTSADEAEDRDAVVFVENAEGTEYLTKG